MPERTAGPDDFALAREALLEITTADTIGQPAGFIDEGDGAISVYFEAEMVGYPGWRWTASIAHLDGRVPTVLEVELMPGDNAILAPDWVPWVDRLAEYRASQDAADLDAADLDAADSDDESDDEDLSDEGDGDGEDSDDDLVVSAGAVLHAGDLDGVDIDDIEIDDESDDDDDESDDDESEVAIARK